MSIYQNSEYRKSLKKSAEKLPVKSGSVLVTGATGLIGSLIIDVLLYANEELGGEFTVYALGRSEKRLKERFSYGGGKIKFIEQDIIKPLDKTQKFDYIVHAASNADPKSYALYPAETIITNVEGARNILEYCKENINTRVILTSTFEVYGKLPKDEYFEDEYGALDQNSMRSGYPESKRVAELMFRAYSSEYGVKGVIGRLSSIYGPTMLKNDSKAHAQFIRNAINGEDIVLKSEGLQKRTYCYVFDAVNGLFTVLFKGKDGEAYNIANKNSVATIAEVAKTAADIAGTNIVFDLPDDIEKRGFSKPQNCILDTKKLEDLGYAGEYDLKSGLLETIKILGSEQNA